MYYYLYVSFLKMEICRNEIKNEKKGMNKEWKCVKIKNNNNESFEFEAQFLHTIPSRVVYMDSMANLTYQPLTCYLQPMSQLATESAVQLSTTEAQKI